MRDMLTILTILVSLAVGSAALILRRESSLLEAGYVTREQARSDADKAHRVLPSMDADFRVPETYVFSDPAVGEVGTYQVSCAVSSGPHPWYYIVDTRTGVVTQVVP